MTTYEALQTLANLAQLHGTHVPLKIEILKPSEDGQNLEPEYFDVDTIESLVVNRVQRAIVVSVVEE